MDGVGYNLNDAISNLVNRTKDTTPFYKRKLFIGIMIGSVVSITVLVVLLVLFLRNDDKQKEEIGEINCDYKIEDSSRKVNILGEEFDKGNNIFDIIINGEKIEFSKEYKFPNAGNNKIQFKMYY